MDVYQTTLRWDQGPVRVPRVIQHVALSRALVRLIVGSTSLKVAGCRHNSESVGTLDFFDHGDSTTQVIQRLRDGLAAVGLASPRDFASAFLTRAAAKAVQLNPSRRPASEK